MAARASEISDQIDALRWAIRVSRIEQGANIENLTEQFSSQFIALWMLLMFEKKLCFIFSKFQFLHGWECIDQPENTDMK